MCVEKVPTVSNEALEIITSHLVVYDCWVWYSCVVHLMTVHLYTKQRFLHFHLSFSTGFWTLMQTNGFTWTVHCGQMKCTRQWMVHWCLLTRPVNVELQLSVWFVTSLVQLLSASGIDVQMFTTLPVHSKTMLHSSKIRLVLFVNFLLMQNISVSCGHAFIRLTYCKNAVICRQWNVVQSIYLLGIRQLLEIDRVGFPTNVHYLI